MNELLDLAFAALADPTRRAILRRLAKGEANVGDIAENFPISQPAISRHLKVLEEAGLIETARVGQSRPRRLRPEGAEQAQRFLAEMASYWPDRFDRLEQFLDSEKDSK
ncbi:metalloregulator ArsR/SmtB family transcription factor [Altererythrobacter salegens]|uniref:Metalloregulator ArsR/SmtB family transcription factor n=1 Tax=Croceibacterium salegens TaxID=1737568 RepID=A0A6I4SVQ9_9SPHN|nr:metalloregulator ArsR/SmtB family transcription factor [Croceibacterium salegens]MXO59137.1 metalloregulator ArsR/SmtB family transcription factor [Croceibacterium salegens]